MATRKQALAAIAAQGGEVDWDVSQIDAYTKHICVDAPEGFLWDVSQAECFVISWYSGAASDFWDEVLSVATTGISEIM